MYFEIYQSEQTGQYWFVIRSLGNHQTLATSEQYHRKESAIHTIQIIDGGRGCELRDTTP